MLEVTDSPTRMCVAGRQMLQMHRQGGVTRLKPVFPFIFEFSPVTCAAHPSC